MTDRQKRARYYHRIDKFIYESLSREENEEVECF